MVSSWHSSADRMITNGEEMIMTLFSRTTTQPASRHADAAVMRAGSPGQDGPMAQIPPSTQTSLRQRLTSHARDRWPQINQIHTRYRAGFAYIDAALADSEMLRLCRLRYGGSASQWGFAIYR